MFYRTAKASEYLAITGAGIDDIKIAKKSWVFPGQRCIRFEVVPVNYNCQIKAMSAEKLPFLLPAVFAIGPRVDDSDSLYKYAKLLSGYGRRSRWYYEVKNIVQGIIEGETRVLAASMNIEDVFKGTKEFKQQVFDKVQLELNQFGLFIYNANVKQLVDIDGYEYFSYLGTKTQKEAANQAKIDASEANMKGEIGDKIRKVQIKQNIAKMDAETKIMENQMAAEIADSNAELTRKEAELNLKAQMAEVEAAKAVALREAELQKEVEKMNALTETEKLKGKVSIEYETKVQEANWELYKQKKQAEGFLYAKEKEAQGIETMAKAQGIYIRTILESLDGNYSALRDYLMISGGTYQELAKIYVESTTNGIGIQQQSISTIDNGDHNNAAAKETGNFVSMLPPLPRDVNDQAGMIYPPVFGCAARTLPS